MTSEHDEEDRPCGELATCDQGGVTHCRMYQRYPKALDEADDGCCVPGCFLDVDEVNIK